MTLNSVQPSACVYLHYSFFSQAELRLSRPVLLHSLYSNLTRYILVTLKIRCIFYVCFFIFDYEIWLNCREHYSDLFGGI